MILRALALVAVAAVLAACGISMRVGSGGLRTYAIDDGILCTLGRELNPPQGTLAGAPDDPERVWLVAPGGRRISVAWPEGFSVAFTPDLLLRNERGQIVATAGDTVVLENASEYPGDGSLQHPYLAFHAFGGCYPPRT